MLNSLALRTDLALLELSGSTVEDYGTHLVVRTPANPQFYWGNFLLLRRPPFPGGAREVLAAFDAEFPGAGHRAVTFDLPTLDEPPREVDVEEFVAAGMKASRGVALTAAELHPPAYPNTEAELRPLVGDEDWEQRIALSVAITEAEGAGSAEAFSRGKAAQERDLEARGLGQRWGAFAGERLLATAGLYRVEGDLARYQSVETAADARRQGLAGTLVHRLAEYGRDQLGARTLVIVADADDEAIRLYRSLGFVGTETIVELYMRR